MKELWRDGNVLYAVGGVIYVGIYISKNISNSILKICVLDYM